MTWPRIFKRETQMTVGVARHVELFMRSRGSWLVYAERKAEHLERDIRDADPPEPISPRQVREVLGLFERAIAFGGEGRCSRWDYEQDGDETLEAIIANARAEEQRVEWAWSVMGSEWLGDPEPQVLLVGDEFGSPNERGPVDFVPFSPIPNSCGLYLMEALPSEWWKSCAVVNARRGRGSGRAQPLWYVWQVMHRPLVIALGNRASEVLDFCEVPHEKVPHPQYWKRFHHRFPLEYTEQLRKAAVAA